MRSAVAVAILALAATTEAIKVTTYEKDDCSGSPDRTAYASNNKCKTVDVGEGVTVSGKVACTKTDADATWVFKNYESDDCTGSSDDAAGTGADECKPVGSPPEFYVKIDCGASACYSGSTFVVLPGDKKVHLSELNVGDRVLSADEDGNLFFDKVFRITTWDNEVDTPFLRITAEDGSSVELTENHYVHVDTLDADSMKLAGEVRVGDNLFTVSGGSVSNSAVAKIERVRSAGMYNVHTLSGRLVVNGVVGSHFSSETTWENSKSYAPYWYKAVDLVSSVFGAEDAKASRA